MKDEILRKQKTQEVINRLLYADSKFVKELDKLCNKYPIDKNIKQLATN